MLQTVLQIYVTFCLCEPAPQRLRQPGRLDQQARKECIHCMLAVYLNQMRMTRYLAKRKPKLKVESQAPRTTYMSR